MAGSKCFACGGELQAGELRASGRMEFVCGNAQCRGGGHFVKCGFCNQISFAIMPAGAMRCLNPACRVLEIVRTVCPTCRKASRIDRGGVSVCMNRSCAENRATAELCFFCGEKSFLGRKDLQFCTKGGCPQLLEEVHACDACGKRSFVVKESRCRNPKCRTFVT
jgi:hypothetical protein